MTSDRAAFIKDGPETPPPYSGNTQLWAEDLTQYLQRRLQRLRVQLDEQQAQYVALEARVAALEAAP